jgi:hypothetical protein
VLPHREWIRQHLPSGDEGTVVEDLDLVMRVYGAKHETDDVGRFMLCELKFRHKWIDRAQKKTFGLIDSILRAGDREGRYLGYFVVQYSCEDWERSRFMVNHVLLSRDEFMAFLQFDAGVLAKIPTLVNGRDGLSLPQKEVAAYRECYTPLRGGK